MARKVVSEDPLLGRLTDDLLTADVRVYQREKGHRFSSDDVVTAYVAFGACPEARQVLDLGCGLGSVLLHLAWKMPEAFFVGIEAQDISFELLKRNVARSGFAARVRIEHGDLRDGELLAALGSEFDLITGTPPYFPADAALQAEDEQRAYARVEYRGGIEAYIAAGVRLLAPGGSLVLCGDARALQRTTLAGEGAGLSIQSRCDVIALEGRPPLFSVWILRREARSPRLTTLTLRRAGGAPTPDAAALRDFSGFGRMSS